MNTQKYFKGNSFADVYKKSLSELFHNPEYVASPRGMESKEITDIQLEFANSDMCLYTNNRRGSQLKYIAAEIMYYFMGRNDVDFIAKYAPFWRTIANPNGTVNSAYGNLIFKEQNPHGMSQWQWAYESLVNDKDSRQAFLLFNKPQYQYHGNKDIICTLNAIFKIRENKLNLCVNMRSNDTILGTATDIAFFSLMQQQMWKLLKETKYPELEMGSFTHKASSYHIYERHYELVEEMLQSDFEPVKLPEIGINLVDINGNSTPEFDELMESVISHLEGVETNYETDDKLFRFIADQLIKN